MECTFLCVASKEASFHIGCIYRAPNSSLLDDKILINELSALSTRYSGLIVCGDFNLPDISWPLSHISEGNNSSSLFAEMYFNTNYYQLVEEPTRFRLGGEVSIFLNNLNWDEFYSISDVHVL